MVRAGGFGLLRNKGRRRQGPVSSIKSRPLSRVTSCILTMYFLEVVLNHVESDKRSQNYGFNYRNRDASCHRSIVPLDNIARDVSTAVLSIIIGLNNKEI